MTCSRRQVITAASVGVALPLLVDESASAAGKAVIATSKVPIGGGVIVTSRELVVTQPTKGKYKVFSAVCTHTGCIVGTVADQRITCPCHGSQFAIASGAVVTGPAAAPLPKKPHVVRKGRIYLK